MFRPISRRRSVRRPISMAVQCRTQSGLRDTGEVSDISEGGCRVRMRGIFFRVGARVVLKADGMEGLSGVVRWIRGDLSGVEFDRPIYGPVVDHLASIHRAGLPRQRA
ncbi:PilZ domain-containing protein [Novosphingobium mangrovi (ex Huang et al. 2023)]|uniref:PilZ domain-containing protein n=1 Tax=Novosphingobium mangrovi (ex Huang et al. 2023) TaxID=2976432 RepID=A0ABT2I243_9SPHN|nr:PilZ domain-containing protein [Novosphingobium mangrovi (ex Huang et al. 2023)]MCT2398872.1 PilZ domain-containing protein [Novosphingobium mangrovi (ex Huang et al. 2023)]